MSFKFLVHPKRNAKVSQLRDQFIGQKHQDLFTSSEVKDSLQKALKWNKKRDWGKHKMSDEKSSDEDYDELDPALLEKTGSNFLLTLGIEENLEKEKELKHPLEDQNNKLRLQDHHRKHNIVDSPIDQITMYKKDGIPVEEDLEQLKNDQEELSLIQEQEKNREVELQSAAIDNNDESLENMTGDLKKSNEVPQLFTSSEKINIKFDLTSLPVPIGIQVYHIIYKGIQPLKKFDNVDLNIIADYEEFTNYEKAKNEDKLTSPEKTTNSHERPKPKSPEIRRPPVMQNPEMIPDQASNLPPPDIVNLRAQWLKAFLGGIKADRKADKTKCSYIQIGKRGLTQCQVEFYLDKLNHNNKDEIYKLILNCIKDYKIFSALHKIPPHP